MNNLTESQTVKMIASIGKRRVSLIEDSGYEGNGFDIVLNKGLESKWGTTMRFYAFDEYTTQKEIIDDLKNFIDSAEQA